MITKLLHQIWPGPPPPPWVENSWRRWDAFLARNHPDWDVVRWRNEPLFTDDFATRDEYQLSWRALSDLMRARAVARYGGVYVDNDTLPLRSFDALVGHRPDWVGRPISETGHLVLMQAFFGASPHSPALAKLTQLAHESLERGLRNDHWVAGPRTFAKIADMLDVLPIVENIRHGAWVRVLRTGPPDADLSGLIEAYPNIVLAHIAHYGRKDI